MAPKPRLAAELRWLPGIAPARARQIVEALSTDIDVLSDLPPLARANAAADRCQAAFRPDLCDAILSFHADRDNAAIVDLLNAERAVSAFPPVGEELVQEAIPQLCSDHAEAVLASVTASPEPGTALLKILSARWEAASPALVAFLDELVDRFDAWSLSSLQQSEEVIDGCLNRIRQDPTSVAETTGELVTTARAWSLLRRPRQFVLAHRHVPDARTDHLFDQVRSVALYLTNDLDLPSPSLAVLEAVAPLFEGAPDRREQLEADLAILRARVADEATAKALEPLHQLITSLRNQHSELCRSVRLGEFGDGRRGLAGDLYQLCKTASMEMAGTAHAMLAINMVVSLAIDLHNDSNAVEEAWMIIQAVERFDFVTLTAEMADRVATNGHIIQNVLLQKNLTEAIQAKRVGVATRVAADLVRISKTSDERAAWTVVQRKMRRSLIQRRITWGFYIAVALTIIIGSQVDRSPSQPPQSATSNYRGAATTGSTPNTQSDSVFVKAVMPPVGVGQLLNRAELVWCMEDRAFLSRIQTLAGKTAPASVVGPFNQSVDNWNSRCSNYRYYQNDLQVASAQVESASSALDDAALRTLNQWEAPQVMSTTPNSAASDRAIAVPDRLLSTTSPGDVQLIQQKLAAVKFYDGPITGVWSDTAGALRRFKISAGLPADSVWDIPTQVILFGGR